MIGFIIGFIIGCVFGILMMCLVNVNGYDEGRGK